MTSLWDELEASCAEQAKVMDQSELAIARQQLSEFCLAQPEGSAMRLALREAVSWIGEKYVDKMIARSAGGGQVE